MTKNAAARAANAVGGQSALARILGCTPQAVQRMCATGRVPAERVLQIEAASQVPRHELRPDLYPALPSQAATAPTPPSKPSRRTSLKPADRRGRRDTDLSTQEAKELLESAEKLSGTLQRIAKG